MRRTRKKSISILVALTFLLGLVFAYAAPAMADTTYGTYTGAYKYVATGENRSAGQATVTEKENGKWEEGTPDAIYVKLTLPSGVEYQEKPVATNDAYKKYVGIAGTGTLGFGDSASNMLQVMVTGTGGDQTSVTFNFSNEGTVSDTVYNSKLNIASDVSGDIRANIEIMAVKGSDILWAESENVTIAKVTAKEVTVTAGDPKLVEVGTNKEGAKITIKESQPFALVGKGETVEIGLQIETPDVTFYESGGKPQITLSASYVNKTDPVWVDPNDKDLAKFTVTGIDHALPAKVEVTPTLNIPPSVSGDIQITVYKYSGADTELEKTTVTVATIGTTTATITDVKDNTGKVYAGRDKKFDTSFKLEAASGSKMKKDKTVIFELSAGKFVDPDANITSENKAQYQGKYNDDKTVWFTLKDDYDSIKFSGFKVKAAGDAAEGDIVLKVSGSAGASGEVVIGKIAKAFTVTADKPAIRALATAQAAGDIVITEAGAGAILENAKLYAKLPDGVTFEGTPSVKVTSGNIKLGSVSVNADGDLEIPVTAKSGIASTIKISGIKYNVGRLALEGDVEVKFVGESGTGKWLDDKVLAKVANATIVSATKREAAFVIGSTSYKVNGEDKTMDVAPYIDAKTGRTYLPVRYVALALGVAEDNIFWDAQARTVTLLKGDRAVQMTIGSKALLINGITITMDAAPEIKDGRTMLPFRWVAQALGASVSWDEATKTVTMNIE